MDVIMKRSEPATWLVKHLKSIQISTKFHLWKKNFVENLKRYILMRLLIKLWHFIREMDACECNVNTRFSHSLMGSQLNCSFSSSLCCWGEKIWGEHVQISITSSVTLLLNVDIVERNIGFFVYHFFSQLASL